MPNPCTRENGHNWRDSDHDQDHCPQHTLNVEMQRIANNLHHILNRQLGTSTHSQLAHYQGPLYRAVEAATTVAFILVTGGEQDAATLRDLMLNDTGEGIWYWLDVLAQRKQDDATSAAESYADIADECVPADTERKDDL